MASKRFVTWLFSYGFNQPKRDTGHPCNSGVGNGEGNETESETRGKRHRQPLWNDVSLLSSPIQRFTVSGRLPNASAHQWPLRSEEHKDDDHSGACFGGPLCIRKPCSGGP